MKKTKKGTSLLAPSDAPIAIEGNIPLKGHVNIGGSKHSSLHILGALWLFKGTLVLKNIPNIWDVRYMLEMYESLGMNYSLMPNELQLKIPPNIEYTEEKMYLASRIRSSILLLGSLLARNGYVKLPAPTGDQIGLRPFAEFFTVLEYFGISYSMKKGFIEASINEKLEGDRTIDLRSHGNNRTALTVILSAANKGKTVIINPLPQPEIIELCTFIDSFICPVRVERLPGGSIKIVVKSHGMLPVEKSGESFSVGIDKCELAFWISAAAITQGTIRCQAQSPVFKKDCLGPLAGINKNLLKPFGISVSTINPNNVLINGRKTTLNPINLIVRHNEGLTTGMALDVCPQFIPLMTVPQGKSLYRDCKYGKSRISPFLEEIRKLGMVASLNDDILEVQGGNDLQGAVVKGKDIRGAALLLIASLGAKQQSIVSGTYHLNRGYDNLLQKLKNVGAQIQEAE